MASKGLEIVLFGSIMSISVFAKIFKNFRRLMSLLLIFYAGSDRGFVPS